MAKDKGKEEEKKESALLEKHIFESRTIMVFGEISMDLAKSVVTQLIALDQYSKKPIKLIVNSPGGHVESGDTIHDMMRFIESEVKVIGTGWVASAGSLIYLGAEKKNRFCLPNTRFLLHQPSGGIYGQVSDVEIQAKEIVRMRTRLNKIIAKETGNSLKKVTNDMDRDYWLSSEEALKYGLVGKIINSLKEIA